MRLAHLSIVDVPQLGQAHWIFDLEWCARRWIGVPGPLPRALYNWVNGGSLMLKVHLSSLDRCRSGILLTSSFSGE